MSLRRARIDDAAGLANVIVTATRETFRGLVPDSAANELTYEVSERNWRRFLPDIPGEESLWIEDAGGEVVGFGLFGRATPSDVYRSAYPVELSSLHVLPAWQGRGTGRSLVELACDDCRTRGLCGLSVRVMADNPNLAFYHHLGAVELMRQPYDWAGYATSEVLLGWVL